MPKYTNVDLLKVGSCFNDKVKRKNDDGLVNTLLSLDIGRCPSIQM